MSDPMKATFGELAPYLADYGYAPVPIRPGGKAPMLPDWQTPRPPEHYLPHHASDGTVTDCRRWGTGILTRTTPAVDLDIRDRELVRVLIELAGEMLGPSPFRVGSPPKVLLAFSTSEPFDKIQGRWFAIPGEDFRALGYAPHRIEVLGDGQEFVSYAIHPGTRRPYRWRRGGPMVDYRIDLPEITEASARAFLWAAQVVIREVGAIPLRREENTFWPDAWQDGDHGPPPPVNLSRRRDKSFAGERFDSSWQRLEPGQLAKAIDAKHARRLRDGGWITSCPAHRSDGHRSLSITPRDGGGSVVHCFGGCDFLEIAREITSIVGRRAA